jgi:N-methylhydantoinase A
VNAGVLSALGMLVTRPGRQLLRTRLGLLGDRDDREIEAELDRLAEQGLLEMQQESIDRASVEKDYSLDLRYLGQSYTLNIPWQGQGRVEQAFHERHQARYGHRMAAPVELVNLRVALRGPQPEVVLPACSTRVSGTALEWLDLPGISEAVPRYARSDLYPGQVLSGPALITEMAATLWVAPHWQCHVDQPGNLRLEFEGSFPVSVH